MIINGVSVPEYLFVHEIAIQEFMVKWKSFNGGQHPEFTEDLWREVVCSGHTLDGYWKWAFHLDKWKAEKGIAE